jgi:hypothetical protein
MMSGKLVKITSAVVVACAVSLLPVAQAAKPDSVEGDTSKEMHENQSQKRYEHEYQKTQKKQGDDGHEMKEQNREQEEIRNKQGGEPPKGMEKQQQNKMEQEQKELGKGSEQGQAAREERKKWWKFWE